MFLSEAPSRPSLAPGALSLNDSGSTLSSEMLEEDIHDVLPSTDSILARASAPGPYIWERKKEEDNRNFVSFADL